MNQLKQNNVIDLASFSSLDQTKTEVQKILRKFHSIWGNVITRQFDNDMFDEYISSWCEAISGFNSMIIDEVLCNILHGKTEFSSKAPNCIQFKKLCNEVYYKYERIQKENKKEDEIKNSQLSDCPEHQKKRKEDLSKLMKKLASSKRRNIRKY